MNAPQATKCPSESVLSDFGLGKLDAASAESISRHIETCADCRQRVAGISGDSFVGRLQKAGGGQPVKRERTYVPGESLADTASSTDGTSEDGLPRPSRSIGDAGKRDGLGSPSSLSAPPELANHPDYDLIKELGQGGMGTVYLAKNCMMDRPEVLKVISKSLLDRPGALERFQQEIRSAAKLAHQNIVAAYSVLRPGDLLVFAMEYVKGQDLAEVVKARGPLPVANAAFYIHQVANGLQHAHEKGMVHRDIKPNNLMLAVEGKKHVVKILDFGLAKATSEKGAETGLTKSGQMLGTPDYVAPEQTLDAHNADIRADIYSLGCTLYFLLSGGPPFKAASLYELLDAHHSREATPLNLLRPDVPVDNPSHFAQGRPGEAAVKGLDVSRHPVDIVSWPDAIDFCNKLSVKEGLPEFYARDRDKVTMLGTGGYRLPTEAEWEYACRAGSTTRWSFGDDETELPKHAWFAPNSAGRPHAVGELPPNAFGLYDMHGNCTEWVWDLFGGYSVSDTTDPTGAAASAGRMARGGAFVSPLFEVRSAGRRESTVPGYKANFNTFRVARRLVAETATAPASAFSAGSVWKGKRTYRHGAYSPSSVTYELHVRERDGAKFKGHVFDNGPGRNRAEVEGEIDGKFLSWRERALHMDNLMTMKGTLDGDTIKLTFNGTYPNGTTNDGDGELKRDASGAAK